MVLEGNKLLFIGHGIDGLYQVKGAKSHKAMPVLRKGDKETEAPLQTERTETELEILHRRLGHVNFKDIDKILKAGNTGFNVPLSKRPVPLGERSCEACLAGRMKEHFNKRTDKRETRKLRRVHCDISGIQAPSVRGYR